MEKIIYKDESYRIIGACFEVYKQRGFGFTEPVYQECLAIEFDLRNIPFVEQPEIQIEYKNRKLKKKFKPDFICYKKIIVEIKALSTLIEANKSQTLNYLNATKFELALLINFGHYPKLEYKRIANNLKSGLKTETIRNEVSGWY